MSMFGRNCKECGKPSRNMDYRDKHFEYCIDCGNKFNNLEKDSPSSFFRCSSCQKSYSEKWQREQDEILGYRIRQKREQFRKKLTIILKPTKIFGFCYKIIMCILCVVLSIYLITCPFKPEFKTFHIWATISFCLFSVNYITENIGELLKKPKQEKADDD